MTSNAVVARLTQGLRLPLIGAPMFLASTPQLVLAQCRAGVMGSFPSLNARPAAQFDNWLTELGVALRDTDAAPFAVNLIVAPANDRLDEDLALCIKHKVPVVITSVGHPGRVVEAVHAYGGLVLHDVISVRHAQKAAEAGVDGLIALCAGAGGHGGFLNPFAFVKEVRRVFDGAVILAGAITSGRDILAARIMGADLVYMGTRFLATAECEVEGLYKQMLLESGADDIVNTSLFSGLRANYLAASIARTGLNPGKLAEASVPGMGTGGHGEFKLWKDIWGAGHGVGSISDVPTVAQLVERLVAEYQAAAAEIRLPYSL